MTESSAVHPPQFSGVFGGVDLALTRWLTATLEHDTHKPSAGIRGMLPLPWVWGKRSGTEGPGSPLLGVNVAFLGLKKLSGGTYLQFGL